MQRAATTSVTQSTTITTTTQNTTVVTKSREQILTQSSGAMIAVIVIGIIIILTLLFIVLKTYNRRTQASRMLAVGSNKPRKKVSTTTNTNLAMSNVGTSSVTGSFAHSNASTENGYYIPRVELGNVERNNGERFSTTSGSTIVTMHEIPSVDNT